MSNRQLLNALLFIILTAGLPAISMAQTAITITGKVLDNYGHPQSGVKVYVKGSNTSASSNAEGMFSIQAVPGEQLVLEHPQFNASTQKITAGKEMVIRLTKRFIPLMEPVTAGVETDSMVVVSKPQAPMVPVLYGEKRADLFAGAHSTVYSEQLGTTPSSLYLNALTGRMAGLYTQQVSGWTFPNTSNITQPELLFSVPNTGLVGQRSVSDNGEIMLSLRGQAPVTLIDGVQRDIYSLDPETIESVTVLKDAMSTVLMGQRSSGGILLVNTKKPIPGDPHISMTAQTGWQSSLGLPDPVSAYQYAYLLNEARLNSGQAAAYTADQFKGYQSGSDPYLFPDNNWKDILLRKNAPISRYSLNVSGGSSTARYIIGLSYMDMRGMYKDAGNNPYSTELDLKRYIVNTKVDIDLNRNFNVGLQIFGRIQDGNQPGAGAQSILQNMYRTPNNAYPVLNPDGSFGGNSTYNTNLYALLGNSGYILNNDKDLMANIDIRYKFDDWIPGLYVKGKASVSVLTSSVINRSKNTPVFLMNATPGGDTTYARYGSISDQRNDFTISGSGQFWFYQATLGYDKQVGDHGLGAMLLFDQYQTTFNFDLPSKYTDVAGQLSYNYKQKYFAEGALNYSGYNRYVPGKQFGLFYAAAAGWNIAKEDFIQDNVAWLNTLKLRVSYGQTGNANVGYFIWRPAFTDEFLPYRFGFPNIPENGVSELPIINPDATWEKARKLNIGLDVAVLQNKLSFTAEYYRDRYFDLMQQRGKNTALIGNNYPDENVGINRYTGMEYSATYQDHAGALNYFLSGNISFANSEIIFQDEMTRRYAWNARTGEKVGQIFGYIAEGLIQTQAEAESSATVPGYTLQPGDIKYADLNNDGIINQFDETAIGNSRPLVFYGITAGISFHGFNVNVLLQGVENRQILPTSWEKDFEFGVFPVNGQAYEHHLGRWTPENAATATYPRLTWGNNPNNHIGNSTFWLQSGGYFRIRNIDVGYTLPYQWTSKLKLSSVRFFVNAQNIFTWSEFDRGDPEVYSGNAYPAQKVINTGVNIKF